MGEKKINSKSSSNGCSTVLLTILLLLSFFIFVSCSVPASTYHPYISAGKNYYKTVLGISPKVNHDRFYTDGTGCFIVNVKFTRSQSKNSLIKLYMRDVDDDRKISFGATSTKPDIVGLSEKETALLEKSYEYCEFNQPLHDMLTELLEDDTNSSEIKRLTNGGEISVYSTDLTFWRNFLKNYERLKSKSYNERIQWLSNQTNEETYFYITKYSSLEDVPDELEEENTIPIEVVQNFPVGSIFELERANRHYKNLFESNEKYELVRSRYKNPVTY